MRWAITFAALIVVVAAGASNVVTDANFDKLRVGMYRQQVVDILGWPDESENEDYEGETVLVWTYWTEASYAAVKKIRLAVRGLINVTEEELEKAVVASGDSIIVVFKSRTYVDPASGYKRPNTLVLIEATIITPGEPKPKIRTIGKGYVKD